MRKFRFALTILFMLMAFAGSSIFVLAADAEYRMMHGEQDAIVVGTIKEVSEDGCLVEKADVIMCEAENTLNRQLPEEKIPEELLVKNIKYHCSYHGRQVPQAGDHIVISVDDKGDYWEQVWMAIEVGGADGPTSIFIAGKLGGGVGAMEVVGVVFLAAAVVAIVMIIQKRKKRKYRDE